LPNGATREALQQSLLGSSLLLGTLLLCGSWWGLSSFRSLQCPTFFVAAFDGGLPGPLLPLAGGEFSLRNPVLLCRASLPPSLVALSLPPSW
jgi:hypothetical protein